MATIIKVARKSGHVYKAVVRRKGSQPVSKCFNLKKDAQQWAHSTERKINLGVCAVAGFDGSPSKPVWVTMHHRYPCTPAFNEGRVQPIGLADLGRRSYSPPAQSFDNYQRSHPSQVGRQTHQIPLATHRLQTT